MTQMAENCALLVVDVQNDFCPGGALPVPNGDEVVPVINSVLPLFPTKWFSLDWHPEDHCSFKDYGGTWPPHCVNWTLGAALHVDLKWDYEGDTLVIKGTNKDKEAYSAFSGTLLSKQLKDKGIDTVYVCGLATDYCVKGTALDARKEGFNVFVIVDACRAVNVNPADGSIAMANMEDAGCELIASSELKGNDKDL